MDTNTPPIVSSPSLQHPLQVQNTQQKGLLQIIKDPQNKKYFLIAVLIIIIMIFWTIISSPLEVVVTGSGSVIASPGKETVSFSAVSIDPNAQNAATLAGVKSQGLIKILIDSGVFEKDIVISQTITSPASTGTGYQSVISIGATINNVSDIDSLVNKLYSGGAYSVSQPVLSASAQVNYEQNAMNLAIDDANKKAGQIALKKWKIFKKIVSITSQSTGTTSTTSSIDKTFKVAVAVSVGYKMW